MRRLIFLCSLLMLFMMSGCHQTEGLDDLKTYEIEVSNFESFFNIAYRVIPGESSVLEVKISPKGAYEDVNGKVYVSVYTNYIFDGSSVKDSFKFEFDLKNELVTIDKSLALGERHQVSTLTIDDVYGSIKIDKEVNIVHKTYEKPFDSHPLEIDNMYENLRIYEAFRERLNYAYQMMENRFSLSTEIIQRYHITDFEYEQSEFNYVEMQASPFYYRYEDDYTETIISSYDQKYYQYDWDNAYFKQKKILSYDLIEDHEIANYVENAIGEIDQLFIFPQRLKFDLKDQTFTIKGYMKDLIGPLFLGELFDGSDLDDTFDDVIVQIEMTILEYEMTMHTSMRIALSDEFFDMTLDLITKQTYDFTDFQKIDVRNHQGYYLQYPDKMTLVTSETDVLEQVNQEDPGSMHAYYAYLEKGVYELEDFGYTFEMFLYDDNQSFVKVDKPNIYLRSDLFEVTESGYYYVLISRYGQSGTYGYSFKFNKTELKDFISSPIAIKDQISYDFEIESDKDIVKLTFEVDQLSLLTFHFDMRQGIDIYHASYWDSYVSDYATDTYIYGATKGKHTLYLKADEKVLGSFSYDLLILPQIYTNHVNYMTELTDTYFENDFYFGGMLGNAYFKLEVLEAKTYKFHMKHTYATLYKVDKVNDGYLYYDSKTIYDLDEFHLDQGTYVIVNNSNWLQSGNMYVEAYIFE